MVDWLMEILLVSWSCWLTSVFCLSETTILLLLCECVGSIILKAASNQIKLWQSVLTFFVFSSSQNLDGFILCLCCVLHEVYSRTMAGSQGTNSAHVAWYEVFSRTMGNGVGALVACVEK
jgi:hypothetical protein